MRDLHIQLHGRPDPLDGFRVRVRQLLLLTQQLLQSRPVVLVLAIRHDRHADLHVGRRADDAVHLVPQPDDALRRLAARHLLARDPRVHRLAHVRRRPHDRQLLHAGRRLRVPFRLADLLHQPDRLRRPLGGLQRLRDRGPAVPQRRSPSDALLHEPIRRLLRRLPLLHHLRLRALHHVRPGRAAGLLAGAHDGLAGHVRHDAVRHADALRPGRRHHRVRRKILRRRHQRHRRRPERRHRRRRRPHLHLRHRVHLDRQRVGAGPLHAQLRHHGPRRDPRHAVRIRPLAALLAGPLPALLPHGPTNGVPGQLRGLQRPDPVFGVERAGDLSRPGGLRVLRRHL